MDILLLIALIVSVTVLFGGFRRPAPQIIVVSAPVPEAVSGGLGCFPLIIVGFLVLVLLGAIPFP